MLLQYPRSIPENTGWRGAFRQQGRQLALDAPVGKGVHSNRSSACKPQNHSHIASRTTAGVARSGVPPTRVEEGAGSAGLLE